MAQEMILCDTNIIIEFLKQNEQTLQALDNIGFANIAISDITMMELYIGARNKNELVQIKSSLSALKRFSITEVISELAVSLVEQYAKSHTLLVPDALIAATALSYNVPLFTYNLKDFRYIAGIALYNSQ